MLSNITEGGRASLQTILMGQPQFRRMLASPDLDQLRQRVLASYHLGPLSREETRAYIEHRLGTVGWRGRPRWDDAAFAAVFDHTGGIPRRINRLCSRVLLYGALEESRRDHRADGGEHRRGTGRGPARRTARRSRSAPPAPAAADLLRRVAGAGGADGPARARVPAADWKPVRRARRCHDRPHPQRPPSAMP